MTRRDFLWYGGLATAALITPKAFAQANRDRFVGEAKYKALLNQAIEEKWKELPLGERMGKVASAWLDTPYVGWTLETEDSVERCTINLDGLDCVTLFENSYNFARHLKVEAPSPWALLRYTHQSRYRDGRMTDYTSRIHYTSEWFHHNHRRKLVKVLTDSMPQSEPFPKEFKFMSEHADSYAALKADKSLKPGIVEMERRLSKLKLRHIPKERVSEIEPMLQTGDIIGLTTNMDGMDISHTGLCYRDDAGVLRFLHASSVQKKVVLDDRLSRCLSGSRILGIMAVRPLEAL